MQRRQVLKGATAAGATAATGGLGLFALTGGGAASDTQLEGVQDASATTDDGTVEYVAYGGRLIFTWDGLDTEATYGGYEVESRVQRDDGSWTSWANHGSGSGPLGDEEGAANHDGDGEFEEGEENTANSWGGSNDSNSGTGTDGYFQFKFGSPYGEKDYAIAYDSDSNLDMDGDGENDVILVNNEWATSRFNENTDGETRSTPVQIRKTCRVYDGDPNNGGTVLIEDADAAQFTVTVENRQATGTTGGEIEGTVGADES